MGNRRFAGETDDAPSQTAERMKSEAAVACTAIWRAVLGIMVAVLEEEITIPPRYLKAVGGPGDQLHLKDFFSDEKPRLGVLSSLAAGADQICAETALAVARTETAVVAELEVVLPFPEEDYPGRPGAFRPEFRPAEAATLVSLAAKARQVIRLDGRYGDREGRRRAYRQARELLLQNADLLVAVYDPLAAGGPAGTTEAVSVALEMGLPVVTVLVAADEARVAVLASPAERPAAGAAEWERAYALTSEGWHADLAQRLRHLLCLPPQLPTPGETPQQQDKRLGSLAESVARLRLMYGELRAHALCRNRVLGSVFAKTWDLLLWLEARSSQRHELSAHVPQPEPTEDDAGAPPYATFYARASELSGLYMRTYRGAFVLAFALAGVAVAAAVALMAVSLLTSGHPPVPLILALGGLKIGVIVVLLVLERASHQGRYQEHATDFRYLAELLRPMKWLAPVATAFPTLELPAHFAPLDPRRGWTPWLFRAIARGTPCVARPASDGAWTSPRAVTLDVTAARQALERARAEWVQGQIRYHWNNACQMHGLDDGLERLAKILLWVVLAFAGAALLLELLPHWLAEPWSGHLRRLYPFAVVLGACAAALPAFIAALGGIMFQSEARRLKIRSEAMYHGLVARQKELVKQVAALETGPSPLGGDGWKAAQHLRALARVMIEETSDWKILYQTHLIRAG